MFTGIVEGVGEVALAEARGANRRLEIDLGPLAEGLRVGDSVAVSGCCLTAVSLEGRRAAFDVIPESLARTWLGGLAAGSRVNLERALRLGARLDGHLVQGHVDGTATIVERSVGPSSWSGGDETRLTFEAPDRLLQDMVEKGSIALDGVSLTLTFVTPPASPGGSGRFGVALIPHTLAVTTLGDRREGDRVNVETDVMAKWVRRLVRPYAPAVAAPEGGS